MIYVKNISYMMSHVFFLVFVYLFMVHRYSKKKTLFICFLSFLFTTVMSQLKLNLFPDSALFYFFTTLTQIIAAQLTGLLISEKRDSRTLFVGLSASNYVVIGSIIAPILYVFTDNVILALAGNLLATLKIKVTASCINQIGRVANHICCNSPLFFYRC